MTHYVNASFWFSGIFVEIVFAAFSGNRYYADATVFRRTKVIATLEPMRPRKEETESVRVSKSVARKARTIAAALGKSLPDYLNERLTEIIDKEFPAAIAALNQKHRHKRTSDS